MIVVGADHAGFTLKEKMKKFLSKEGYEVVDVGNFKLEKRDDYPDYGYKAAKMVKEKKARGILFCGSAEGVCIVANKVKGIRAVPILTEKLAKFSREHNDANVLCLSGWFLSEAKAKKIIKAWLGTKFSKVARHQRRINKIKKIERKEMK